MSACRVRCAQVTIEGMELYDAVHWTVHIEHSETVAVNNCNIWGDPLIPNSAGIVIDGSKRVYLGENTISTADNAITVRTPQGQDLESANSLPLLLLDNESCPLGQCQASLKRMLEVNRGTLQSRLITPTTS